MTRRRDSKPCSERVVEKVGDSPDIDVAVPIPRAFQDFQNVPARGIPITDEHLCPVIVDHAFVEAAVPSSQVVSHLKFQDLVVPHEDLVRAYPGDQIYAKLYRKHEEGDAWKTQLDWYHDVLRGLVQPWVSSHAQIVFVVFGIYGPRECEAENVQYEKRISPPQAGRLDYVRLRACVP